MCAAGRCWAYESRGTLKSFYSNAHRRFQNIRRTISFNSSTQPSKPSNQPRPLKLPHSLQPCQNNSSGMSVCVTLTHYSRLTGGLALHFLSWASDFTGYDSANLPTHFPFLFFLYPCFCSASSQVLACIDWMLAERTLFCFFCTQKECVFHLLSSEKRHDHSFFCLQPNCHKSLHFYVLHCIMCFQSSIFFIVTSSDRW